MNFSYEISVFFTSIYEHSEVGFRNFCTLCMYELSMYFSSFAFSFFVLCNWIFALIMEFFTVCITFLFFEILYFGIRSVSIYEFHFLL